MIDARRLTMAFAGKTVVDDLTLRVEAGEVVGFLGPNGAGKSTTMRMLAGYLTPMRGAARICGHDVHRERLRAQTLTGYLPEAAGGFPQLRVGEFLRFCGEARGLRGQRLDGAIARVCELVELGPELSTPMRVLSKGWRQRAWFAQAILHDPPVLILDEPTDGLDPNQKDRVRELVRCLAPGKAILLSTHILEEAEELCHRAVIVTAGRIVADDTPQALSDERGRLGSVFRRLTTHA